MGIYLDFYYIHEKFQLLYNNIFKKILSLHISTGTLKNKANYLFLIINM